MFLFDLNLVTCNFTDYRVSYLSIYLSIYIYIIFCILFYILSVIIVLMFKHLSYPRLILSYIIVYAFV